jgi:hypothetical protein
VTGVPLVYVIRILIILEDKDDDPPFGEEDTKYTSVDMETTACTPILSDDADYNQDYDTLEAHGPFVPSFLTDTKKVWFILLACFCLSSAWQHVKKFAAQQNGCQAWRTLHNHFCGGDKVNTMVSDILSTLCSLHYSGNRKYFNFEKYCTAHVEQHNCHAARAEYGVAPLEKTMKIHYFENEISDSSFAFVKSTIMVDHQKFQEFDTVMRFYMNYKHTQKAEALTHQARNASALQGCGGGRQGHAEWGRGGRGGPDACLLAIVPQEEVDKVTTVKNKWYPPAEYSKFTPAKKQKHFQLRNAGKIPGTGPCRKTNKTNKSSATVAELTSAVSAVSTAASAISDLAAMTNKSTAAEDGETNDDDTAADSEWGWNHNNPAVACRQERMPKKPKNWPIRHSTLSAFRTTWLAIDPRHYITDLSNKVNYIGETTLQLDLHADTCVLGRDAF